MPDGDDLGSVTIGPAVAAGTYRQKLEAIRDKLAASIDGAGPRQLIHVAPLTKQLTEVLRLLEELPDENAPADSVETAQETVEAKLRLVQ